MFTDASLSRGAIASGLADWVGARASVMGERCANVYAPSTRHCDFFCEAPGPVHKCHTSILTTAAWRRKNRRMSNAKHKTPIARMRADVRRFEANRSISNREWAGWAGVSEGSIRRIKAADWSPTAENLERLWLSRSGPLESSANQTRLSA